MAFQKVVYRDKKVLITAKNMNDIQDAIIELQETSNPIIGDASGQVISLTDAADLRLYGLTLYGKTTQLKTEGVQMIPMPYNSSGTSSGGVTFAEQADGGVKCTGTATTGAYYTLYGGFFVEKFPVPEWLVEGETYTISGGTNDLAVLLVLYKEDETSKQFAGAPELSFVMPSGYSYCGIFLRCASGKTVDTTIYPMLNVGSTAANYEPYTSGKPSPSPDYPQELVSTGGSGSITVNVTGKNYAQSMGIFTPNGLPGIPVASGGNYTDVNGQQWICDEKDFARGVYVRRVNLATVNASGTTQLNNGGVGLIVQLNPQKVYKSDVGLFCTHAPFDIERTMVEGTCYENQSNVVICGSADDTLDSLLEKYGDAKFLYVLRTPSESPLPEEELAAYAALHTYRNNTTVSNDAGAYMELEYVMDAKKYIDSISGGGGGPAARIANVTLLASAWKTEADGLHSQVVNIAGITEYSKVDLLPSVEQLAIFHNKDVAFVTENEDGVVTVFAIGDKPLLDYTMQAQITEVVV